ncbi:MAG: aminotransferase class IV [Desulfobacula sp.]|uniref:aminotransferase class IV n=1 Tax=Desulfobacula sp. TaxID=2593537 RepID=UPI0025B921E9|nr:aminotransferase class IV [Desulfobacula sp.]MCD4719379.1 aminotransferase class IV [Desulfobacula sp.]
MKIYYVDGKFVPSDQAVIPVDDLAVLRGYGVCDIMRTYRGRPYFLSEHIHRLENSAKEIGLSLPWQTKDIKNIVLETLKRNNDIDEANIRIIITGGSSHDFIHPQGRPRLIILITDINKLPDSWYEKGVKVITHPLERIIPDAKIISYIPAAMALKKAKKKEAIEAIYINRNMEVLEGTTSNLFAFFDNTLVTPREGVLKGITRHAILSLAKKIYKIEERPIGLEQLLKANEVFITGTNKCVVPVIQIDNTKIGLGMPGPNTKRIVAELENHTRKFINA